MSPFEDHRVAGAAAALGSGRADGPLTTRVVFADGERIAVSAGSPAPDAGLGRILPAMFLHSVPPPEALTKAAVPTIRAVLRLGDAVVRRAGLSRYAPRSEAPPRDVGQQALQLTHRDVETACDGDLRHLEPLIKGTDGTGPIVRSGDEFLVERPDEILPSLQRHLIGLAATHGWTEELTTRCAGRTLLAVGRSLRRLGWHEIGDRGVGPEGLSSIHELWSFDDDGVAIISMIVDDFREQTSNSMSLAMEQVDALRQVRDQTLTQLYEYIDAPHKALHLVVLAGVAGPPAWLDTHSRDDLPCQEVSLYLDDLDTMSFAERGDPLALWRFAVDTDRLEGRPGLMDPLELFALWRANAHSFYVSDDARPTHLISEGYAEALRQEISHQHDRHAVPGPYGRGFIEVVRRFEHLLLPLYVSERGDPAGVVVDDANSLIWVLADPDEESGGVVDAVAFWMWRIAQELNGLAIEIQIEIANDGNVDVHPENDRLLVRFDPLNAPGVRRDDNAAERALVERLLEHVLPAADREAALKRIAPLGPRRMLLRVDDSSEVALDGRRLPWRNPLVRGSDDGQALDERGAFLDAELNLPVGPIEPDRRVEVLQAGIGFHIAQLQALVATLNPEGLLERLIAAHEGLLHRGAVDRHSLANKVACFGDSVDVVGQYGEAVAEMAADGPALRFVIEAVAATPCAGLRPVSQEVIDRLVAIAAQVCSLGGAADVIREQLEDTRVSMLPSGRLGIGRDGTFHTGRERYADAFLPGEVRRAHRASQTRSQDAEPSAEILADSALVDAAAVDEWGATMEQIFSIFFRLIDLADGNPAHTVGLNTAIEQVAMQAALEPKQVAEVINHFALCPRNKLLEPPAPFKPADVYPWRYGRRLSFVRRPMVIRPSNTGDVLVYGFRGLDSCARSLMAEIQEGRLKAESRAMRQAITKISQAADERFNDEIADLYDEQDDNIVRRRVQKIGSLVIKRDNGETIGDIDVMCADTRVRTLYLVETKNLSASRTPIEVARESRRTFKTAQGRAAAIDRHLERAAWVRSHMAAVLGWLGVDEAPDTWTAQPSIVTSVEVAAAFLHDLPMPVINAQALREQLADEDHGLDGYESAAVG